MKPLFFILSFVLLFVLIGWTWSELPRPQKMFVPLWTRSYQLYKQPHAMWLDQYNKVGANLPKLERVLQAAAKKREIPEIVVYAIPLRDLGQSSVGGFTNYPDYLADNRLNAELVGRFVKETGIVPRIYLEPDSIPLSVQYRRDNHDSEESVAIYKQRIEATNALIDMYRKAGAQVYLEAGHSGWFDYGPADVERIAHALNEAGIGKAHGIASNVSNRQPVEVSFDGSERTELHYMARLLPYLDNHDKLDVVTDTSRNGGVTKARKYFLSPDGLLYDNEVPQGRLVGRWRKNEQEEVWIYPFHGKFKQLSRLLAKEKYQYDPKKSILTAPPWLDAVGDVKLGPPPTDQPPAHVAKVIHRYRYIKPPDDCDGALNCPPGESKHDINEATAKRQPQAVNLSPALWAGESAAKPAGSRS